MTTTHSICITQNDWPKDDLEINMTTTTVHRSFILHERDTEKPHFQRQQPETVLSTDKKTPSSFSEHNLYAYWKKNSKMFLLASMETKKEAKASLDMKQNYRMFWLASMGTLKEAKPSSYIEAKP